MPELGITVNVDGDGDSDTGGPFTSFGSLHSALQIW